MQRQYIDRAPFTLSGSLRKTFRYMQILRGLNADRVMRCNERHRQCPLLAASDGQGGEDQESCGISCLIADQDSGVREGMCARIYDDLTAGWPEAETHIMRIEALGILSGVIYLAQLLTGRSVIWFVDNSSALGALLKGRSRDPMLHTIVQIIHLLLFVLDTRVWWEWVESKSNWSDGSSRLYLKCPWARRNGFSMREVTQPWITARAVDDVIPQLLSLVGIGEVAAQAICRVESALGRTRRPATRTLS